MKEIKIDIEFGEYVTVDCSKCGVHLIAEDMHHATVTQFMMYHALNCGVHAYIFSQAVFVDVA